MDENCDFAYQTRIVAFIDVVGFSALVEGTKGNQRKTNDLIRSMKSIDRYFRSISGDSLRATVFSDSIVLSVDQKVPAGDFFVAMAKYAFSSMKEMGLIVRGAITQGEIYHEAQIVIGPAMVRAYELESKSAIYPRVILDPDVSFDIPFGARIFKPLRCDFDGLNFVNFFSREILEYHKPTRETPDEDLAAMVEQAASANPPKNTTQQMKHSWLASYAASQKPLTNKEKDALGEDISQLVLGFIQNLRK